MDFVGILKEAWAVTWRHKALWVLGLFTAGSATVSSFNWNSGASDWQQDPATSGEWEGWDAARADMREALMEVGDYFDSGAAAEWLPWVLVGIAFLFIIGIVFWVVSIAAKGGLIDQSNEALAGNDVSAGAGWRFGFRRWGRVFLIQFLLGLPQLILGLFMLLVLGAGALVIFDASGDVLPGLLALGALVPLIVLALVVVGVLVGMIREVAFRRGLLADHASVESLKTAWADLRARRGVATMWLVMLVVGIGAGVASGIVMVPLLLIIALVTGVSFAAAGEGALWVLLPLGLIAVAVGMLLKAVYATFFNTAWTSFYRRMTAPAAPEVQTDPVAEAAVPEGTVDAG